MSFSTTKIRKKDRTKRQNQKTEPKDRTKRKNQKKELIECIKRHEKIGS